MSIVREKRWLVSFLPVDLIVNVRTIFLFNIMMAELCFCQVVCYTSEDTSISFYQGGIIMVSV